MVRAPNTEPIPAPVPAARALNAGHPKMEAQQDCKAMCQRFGMKFIAKSLAQKGEADMSTAFEKIHNPTECSIKCEAAFPTASLAQVHGKPAVKSCVGAE